MTELSEGFRVMTWSLYLVDGRRAQVRGVVAWERLVAHAAGCAAGCGRPAEMPDPFPFRFHAGWQELCGLITGALRAHAAEAQILHSEMNEAARVAGLERDQLADAAARHAAERDRHLRWAAGAGDDRLRAVCEEAAAAEERARAEAERQAAKAAERQVTAIGEADKAMTWRVAAIQAAGAGDLLVMSENAEVEPLIRAYANAGGRIAGAKGHHTMMGGAA